MKILITIVIIGVILLTLAAWAICASAGKADDAAEKLWAERYHKGDD